MTDSTTFASAVGAIVDALAPVAAPEKAPKKARAPKAQKAAEKAPKKPRAPKSEKAPEAAPEKAPEAVSVSSAGRRALSISESWKRPEVRAARITRHGVRVTGPKGFAEEFGSVKKAFAALGLPLSKRIPFRQKVKAAGDLGAFWGELHFVAIPAGADEGDE